MSAKEITELVKPEFFSLDKINCIEIITKGIAISLIPGRKHL